MLSFLMGLIVLAGGYTSVEANVVSSFIWSVVLRLQIQSLWKWGAIIVNRHANQPQLPPLPPVEPKPCKGSGFVVEEKEISHSFVLRPPTAEEARDKYFEYYTLATSSRPLRRNFERLFGNGASRYVFWNMSGVGHQIFHYGEGHTLPNKVDPSARLICCHPEMLPVELRTQHLFPNGVGPVYVQRGVNKGMLIVRFMCEVK